MLNWGWWRDGGIEEGRLGVPWARGFWGDGFWDGLGMGELKRDEDGGIYMEGRLKVVVWVKEEVIERRAFILGFR